MQLACFGSAAWWISIGEPGQGQTETGIEAAGQAGFRGSLALRSVVGCGKTESIEREATHFRAKWPKMGAIPHHKGTKKKRCVKNIESALSRKSPIILKPRHAMKFLHLTTITALCLFFIGCDLQFAASEEKTIPVSGKVTGELGERGEALVFLKGAPKRSVVVYCRVGDDSDYNTFQEVSCILTEATGGTVAAIPPDITKAGWDYEVEYFYGLPPQ